MSAASHAEAAFARAMNGKKFGPVPAARNPAAPDIVCVPEVPNPAPAPASRGDVHLGDADLGGAVDLDLGKLIEGRLLVQGTSGAGKSWTLRRILEQTAGMAQQIVLDPEGDFRTLADGFGHLVLDASLLDAAALREAAGRAREHRLSLIVDLSQLDREDQMIAVAAFLEALIGAPREHWHPCLVAIDEAHLFAPFGGQTTAATSVRKAAIGAVVDLMSRGRKRGLCGILATQRLARLAKSVASEAVNFLIGLNTLDLDIRRAAETIGWDARRAFDRLPMLSPGDFVAVGPTFSRSPAVLRVGPVTTRHRGATPTLAAPAQVSAGDAAQLLGLDALIEASAADAQVRDENAMLPGLKAVRAFIRDEGFPIAGRIWEAVRPLAPEGAAIAELAQYLGISAEQVAGALALLDRFGVVEFTGDGQQRAVRISRGFVL